MDFSHWDIEDAFRLHVAACLIAGVMPLSQRFPDADEIPAAAQPVLKKLSTGYYFGTMLDESEAVSSPRNPKEKWLFGIAPDPRDLTLVWKHPRGAIRKGVTTPDIDAMILGHLKHAMASREELCRWVKAMGIKSAYDFAPVTEPEAAGGLPDAVSRVKWTDEHRGGAESAHVVAHSTKGTRRNVLAPVIEHAQNLCTDPEDVAQVWAQLERLAGQKYGPLVLMTDGDLVYTDGGETMTINRDATSKRIKRAAASRR